MWAFWRRENPLNLRGIEQRFFCLAACGLITTPTDISWLLRNVVVTCHLLSVTINCRFVVFLISPRHMLGSFLYAHPAFFHLISSSFYLIIISFDILWSHYGTESLHISKTNKKISKLVNDRRVNSSTRATHIRQI